MALTNGAINGALLFAAAGSAGASLRLGTAARWSDIRDEVHALYGWWPEVTSAGDGYRSQARQETLFRRNYVPWATGFGPPKFYEGQTWWRRTAGTPSAAVPGTSNHGLGTTVDVVGLGSLNEFTSTRYRQFAYVAARHGFSNAEGRSIGEPWHWSDTRDPDIAPTGSAPPAAGSTTSPTSEDDMPLTDTDLDLIEQRAFKTLVENVVRGPEFRGMVADVVRTELGKPTSGVADQVWAKTVTGTGPTGEPWADIAAAWLRDARVDAARAASGGVDVAALATALAPALTDALRVGLTEAQVVAAVRTVFADAGKADG